MVLDFTKGKYGLQLILLLFIMLISGLIFQLLGITIVNSVFNFDFSALNSDNSSQLIMENENGYWIFFVLMILNNLGLFILPSLVFAKLMEVNASHYLSFDFKKSLNFILLLPLFSLTGIVVVAFMGELNLKLNLPDIFNSMENEANELISFIISNKNSGNLISTILLMAVLPALGEELFFRGVLQKIFILWTKNNWMGILITAFIFSAIHMQFLTFLPRFFMGIMLGYLFLWSRNLLIPIIAHLLHNLISILISTNTDAPEIQPEGFNNLWLVLISVIIMVAISIHYYSLSNKNHV